MREGESSLNLSSNEEQIMEDLIEKARELARSGADRAELFEWIGKTREQFGPRNVDVAALRRAYKNELS